MKRKISLFLLIFVALFTLVCANIKVSATGQYFEKVTSAPSDWSGTYLIVSEGSKVAFNGGLSSLDSTKNNITVDISDGKIVADAVTNAASFTIESYSSGYSIKSKSGIYIGRDATSNGMTTSSSAGSTVINTISISNGNVTIKGAQGPTLQFNKDSNQMRFRYFKSSQQAIQLYKLNEGSSSEPHVCVFENNPIVSALVSEATCTKKAVYAKVCSCGELSDETYEYGITKDHNPDTYGICTVCNQLSSNMTASESVRLLFKNYYNNGTYTKDSVLNVNANAIKEVANYFHAEQTIRYRRTVYTPGALEMVTSLDGVTYSTDISRYEDKDGHVYHTGLGLDYDVPSWSSVEDTFITLNDFANSKSNLWTYANGVFTHLLDTEKIDYIVGEEDMTRFAREFVAPMWLAPNEDNINYHNFSKITVEVIDNILVIKLHVTETNSGILVENSNNVFSQVSVVPTDITLNPDELEEKTYSYTFTQKTFDGNKTMMLNGIDWTISGDGEYWGYDSNATSDKGQQFGSGGAPYKSLTVSSTIFKNVSKIVINTSGATDIKGDVVVKVGNKEVGTITLTNKATNYSFDVDNYTGSIEFIFTQTSSKAIYIKSITVDYAE